MTDKNFQFEADGYIYMTLVGFNYMNMNICNTTLLPEALCQKVERTLDKNAVIHDDLNVYWDFSHRIQATFTVTSGGKTYLFDSTNTVTPLREVELTEEEEIKPVPALEPEQKTEPEVREEISAEETVVPEVSVEEAIEETPADEVVSETEAAQSEEQSESKDVIPSVDVKAWEEKFNNLDLAMNFLLEGVKKFDAEIVAETEKSKQSEPVVPVRPKQDDQVFYDRIDCYSLSVVDMKEVEEKGDVFCVMHNWKAVDGVYMIDDVASVCRCIHSDAQNLHRTIPYSDIVAYGKQG